MGICVSSEVKRHRRRQRQRHGRGRERERGRAAIVRKHSEMARESPSKPDGSTSRFSMVNKNINDLREAPAYSNVDIFTYDEIKYATKHFRPDLILGEGGFGVVYKGVINENMRPGYKTKQVAIKELNRDGFQGDREWLAEVNYLGQLSHPNLVKLSGYCCEEEHRILVYEYMENGSLEKHIFRRAGCSLTWPKRMKIALDAAKGLAFLHGAERPIIYRDFKTSNILLDADFNAKLSDFGLAKEGPMGDQTHVSTRVMGTHGYAAPEYIMTGHLTARSDVYGFGVVLLEMLIGRRVMDKSRPSQEYNLVEWARPLLNHNKKLSKILDPKMEGQYSTRTIIKVAHLAYQCLSQNPKGRPLMSQVVELLEGIRNKTDGDLGDDAASGVTIFEDTPEEINSMRSNSERKTERRGNRPRSIRSKSEPPKDFDLCCPSTDYTPNLVSNEKPDIF